MSLIRSGKLDRRVTVLRRLPEVDDGMTLREGDWAVLFFRQAWVKPRMGREASEAGGRDGVTVMSFWMRWDPETRDIASSDALELDGQRYTILAPPIEVGRREGIEVLAQAGGMP
jgi:head-tail adaptor